MKKTLKLVVTLCIVVALAIPVLVFATQGGSDGYAGNVYYDSFEETVSYEENTEERQLERLHELMNGNFIIPFGSEPTSVPSINAVAPIDNGGYRFFIGLDYYPTQECIDFILYYTGIPRSAAHITQGWWEPIKPFVGTLCESQNIEDFLYNPNETSN